MESLLQLSFAAALLFGVYCELRTLGLSIINTYPSQVKAYCVEPTRRFWQRLMSISQDYVKRSGIYYKPFGRREPVMIRSAAAIRELSDASELSQRAGYADIFGFKHTLSNSKIGFDPSEQYNQRYRLFSRAIRINGLSQMGALQPYLRTRLEKTFSELVEPQVSDEWSSVQLSPIMRDLATGMLAVYVFGEKLCQEPAFSSAMTRFYDDTIAYMAALQFAPTFLHRLIYFVMTKDGHAMNVMFDRLRREKISKQERLGNKSPLESVTLFNNMVEASADNSKYWTDEILFQAMLGIWFAAAHQPWINLHFVFLELCARPEYVRMIEHEIQQMENLDVESINNQLPILDSFIKEAVRLNPLDKMAIRRKAMKPYTFKATGTHLSMGEFACVPAWDIMHDESQYPKPNTFDGLRFMSSTHGKANDTTESPMRGTRFTDASKDFPIWGLGSKVCPGRWHADLVIKMALVHLISNYEFRLMDEPKSYVFFWETFQLPRKSSKVMMKKRKNC